ncbi:MAG: hypothetical protein IKW66_01760 [Clostridia bacterium]|nr:hypothetical protein [Clostridia bacterium]
MANKQHPADKQADEYLSIERAHASHTKGAHLTLLIICAALLLVMGLSLCLLPQSDFSPEENRSLATAPAFSIEALLDGSLTAGIADFCADQFPLRTLFVSAKARIELLLGKQENNSVLLGSDGYLIARQEYTEAQKQILSQNITAASRFGEALELSGIPFTFAVVPRSVDVNTAKLPAAYDAANAAVAWDWLEQTEAEFYDLTDVLQAAAVRGEAVWYKTDHHWTTSGAYHAYVALAQILGYTPYPLEAFSAEVVCDDFYGTTHASSGMRWVAGDHITLLRYEGDNSFVTEIIESGKTVRTLAGLYDLSALDTHDEYNVFLGGTNTFIRVTDPTREDAPTLVLLKDSFSQSLAPLLARHFDLLLVDPRTYDIRSSGSLLSLIEQENADHVLLLYGIDTLCDSYSLKNLTFGLK